MKSHPKLDPIATAEAAVRSAREQLSLVLGKQHRIDADTLLYASAERDQTARPTDFAQNQRRLAAIREHLRGLRADEQELSAEISSAHATVASAEAALRRAQSVKGAQRVRELLPASSNCTPSAWTRLQGYLSTLHQLQRPDEGCQGTVRQRCHRRSG
jgi:septal ring factor EnvC (AmiA/AmiB activator)